MVYKWKTGYFKTDANIVGEVFEELDKTIGLTAKNVVDASRDENAPLHNEFEWDNEIAGEEWRKQQARTMIANLSIVIEDKPDIPVKAFVMVENKSDKYENIVEVLTNKEKTDSLLRTATRELLIFKRKYSALEELAGVMREIRKLNKEG